MSRPIQIPINRPLILQSPTPARSNQPTYFPVANKKSYKTFQPIKKTMSERERESTHQLAEDILVD